MLISFWGYVSRFLNLNLVLQISNQIHHEGGTFNNW